MNPFQNIPILVPVDFSDDSHLAVDVALALASSPQLVHVFHVCPSLILYEPAAVSLLSEHETREQYREAFRKSFSAPRYKPLQLEVRFGDPGMQIIMHANHLAAKLIVIPSHGRTGLSRLLLGSVAERVLRYADCPVLVLRHQGTQLQRDADQLLMKAATCR
jgi:nucleotide-binding universal stress UspA family protein